MAKDEKLNEEAAPNNNLSAATYRMATEFSEELSDGGDRNEMAEMQAKEKKRKK